MTETKTGASAPNSTPVLFQRDDLVKITENGKPVTTSLIIAEKFEKNHNHVLRDIENLECSDEFSLSNFGQSDYKNERGKKYPMYLVTRDGFTLLAMGFTGKKAMDWKEKYISAFNAMEKEIHGRSTTRLSKADSDGITYIMSTVDTIHRDMARLTELRAYNENPVAPFCSDQCSYHAAGFILKDEIYSRYKSHCYIRDEYTLSKPMFFRKLYKHACFIKPVKRTIKGKASYGITGLRLKDLSPTRIHLIKGGDTDG